MPGERAWPSRHRLGYPDSQSGGRCEGPSGDPSDGGDVSEEPPHPHKGSASCPESRTPYHETSSPNLPAPSVSPPAHLSPPLLSLHVTDTEEEMVMRGETDDHGHPPFHGLPNLMQHDASSGFKISLRSGSSTPEPTKPHRISGRFRGFANLDGKMVCFIIIFFLTPNEI